MQGGKTCVSMRKMAGGRVVTRSRFGIHLGLGQSCNFQCGYCTQGKHDNSKFGEECAQDLKLCGKINERLAGYISSATGGRMNPSLTFIGGEPTLYPVGEYLGILRETIAPSEVILITNLSAEIRFYGEMADKWPLRITASYHGAQFSLERFKRKCVEVRSAGVPLSIQFTLTGSNTEECLDLKRFAGENGMGFHPSLMRVAGKVVAAVPEGVDIADPPTYACTLSDGTQRRMPRLCNMPDFPIRGMACSIARDSLYVRHDGELLYNLGCRSGRNRIGNLFEGDCGFVFDGSPVTCVNDLCSCVIPKWLRRMA